MALSQELLKRVIIDQHKTNSWPQDYIPRLAEKRLQELGQNKEIIVLSGLRRCGKSVLLEYARRNKTKGGKDYYFNFEDERLVNFNTEDFELLHQTFIALYGEQTNFYFDEIQNIPAWELFIRRLYNAGHKIYLTGSNANLFSEELGTRLTGRYILLKVYPISFAEISQAKIPLSKKTLGSKEIGSLLQLYYHYSETGGIPAYITHSDKDYLHSLYESILYRDIVARYKINNPEAIKKLLFYLASNCAKEMSFSKLLGMINSNGKIINSVTTISDYCSYIENSFLCFFVPKYACSINSQLQAPKKIYFIDHALAKAIGFRQNEDKGHLLENTVFLELKRRNYEVFYHKENQGCDFVVRDKMHTLQVIQVSFELSDPGTKKREIKGLIEAMEKFNLEQGLIITETEDGLETFNHNDKKYQIKIISVWRWLREF